MGKKNRTRGPRLKPWQGHEMFGGRYSQRKAPPTDKRMQKTMHANSVCEVCNVLGANRKVYYGYFANQFTRVCYKRECYDEAIKSSDTTEIA